MIRPAHVLCEKGVKKKQPGISFLDEGVEPESITIFI